jgi:uncharacterized YigZ family protein
VSDVDQVEYRTIRAGAHPTGEVTDRKSRFIAQLAGVSTMAEADAFIEQVRSLHHDARHNVPAWVLADGRERVSDDGEPQRTAGMPVLEALHGAGLADVCCVVTRYFGGTLLGPGGLVRAYASATQEAISAAEREGSIATMTLVTSVVASVPYAAFDRVRRLATDSGGHVTDTIFAEDVQLQVAFRCGDEVSFTDALRELAAGEDLCVVHEPTFSEF